MCRTPIVRERRAWPGYDYLMQAEAGYCSLTGEPDGPPARFGVSIVDMMTGLMTVFGLVSGVLGARKTGIGMDVDVSLFDTALHNLNYLATWYLTRNVEWDVLRVQRLRIAEKKKGLVYAGDDVKVYEERNFYEGLGKKKGDEVV